MQVVQVGNTRKGRQRQAGCGQELLFAQPLLRGMQHRAGGAHGHTHFKGNSGHLGSDIFKLKGDHIHMPDKISHCVQVGIGGAHLAVGYLAGGRVAFR